MTDRLDLPRRCREELEALLREHVPNANMMLAFAEWEGKTVRERSIAGQLRAR